MKIFTQKENMLFRYAGSKRWLRNHLEDLPKHKRLCELYLGSGSMIFNTTSEGYGIDRNPLIISVYYYLYHSSPQDIINLEKFRQKSFDKSITDIRKMDIEGFGLVSEMAIGALNYIRVNCCGLIAGDFQSYKMYGKKFLPVERTLACLDKLKQSKIKLGEATDYKEKDGDLVFLDPPYLDLKIQGKKEKEISHMLYKDNTYNPQDTIDLVSRIQSPIIFCYGSTAKEVFPMYDWLFVKSKKVGNVKRGNTERSEYITFINCSKNFLKTNNIFEV